jgi:glycine oxidase
MTEIIVIGGGLAGAAAALALAERGAAVTVIDAERPGSAATGASAGMLAPQYESAGPGPLYRVLLQARAYYPRFASLLLDRAGVDIALRWDGMLVANLDEAERAGAESMLRWQHAHGQRGEILSAADARRRQPGVAADVDSWLWLHDEGQVDAQHLAERLTHVLEVAGVRVLNGRRAVRLLAAGGAASGVVLEDGRTLQADAVLLAAGAWSDGLAGLPRRLCVRPVRGHILRYPAGAAPGCIVASHAGRYLVPRNDGTLIAGSTMDESGFDRSIDEVGLAAVHDTAVRLLPALRHVKAREHWADLRPISPDGYPVIGLEPELPGLCYATGYGRNGILLAPLAGEIAAAALLGGNIPAEWRAFSPDRLPLATAPG